MGLDIDGIVGGGRGSAIKNYMYVLGIKHTVMSQDLVLTNSNSSHSRCHSTISDKL